MAHFAELDSNNYVLQVLVVDNDRLLNEQGVEEEQRGIDMLTQLFPGTIWKQTSYNGKIRKNYASVGYKYDEARDAFIPPQDYPSWSLDENTCKWVPPVPRPNTDSEVIWHEPTQEWVVVYYPTEEEYLASLENGNTGQ